MTTDGITTPLDQISDTIGTAAQSLDEDLSADDPARLYDLAMENDDNEVHRLVGEVLRRRAAMRCESTHILFAPERGAEDFGPDARELAVRCELEEGHEPEDHEGRRRNGSLVVWPSKIDAPAPAELPSYEPDPIEVAVVDVSTPDILDAISEVGDRVTATLDAVNDLASRYGRGTIEIEARPMPKSKVGKLSRATRRAKLKAKPSTSKKVAKKSRGRR